MSQNPLDLAGASDPDYEPEDEVEVRELFPVKFDRDFKDFRPDAGEEDATPKGLSARASVTTPPSTTGLEDVSKEDSEPPAPKSAAKAS